MPESWILAIVNLGGAVTVTALFLWFHMKREERTDLLAKELMARMEKEGAANRDHNKQVANDYATSVGRMFEAVTTLAERSVTAAEQTAGVIAKLDGQVSHLTDEIRQLKPRR